MAMPYAEKQSSPISRLAQEQQYAQNAKPPEGICDRLMGFITRLRVLSEELASAGDRIYGPQPKEVSGQAIAPTGGNHIAALAEIDNLIEQCEAESRRLQRGL